MKSTTKSMTGFGQARVQGSESIYEVNVKTVNGRFLEVRFHIPREMVFLESDLKKIISEKIMRGTVDVFVSRRAKPNVTAGAVIVNTDLAQEYVKAFKSLSKTLKIKFTPTVELLTRFTDVVKLEDTTDYAEKEKKWVLEAFTRAVGNCEKERLREGEALNRELAKFLTQLEELVSQIFTMREEANRLLQEKFEAKIQARLKTAELDSQRLLQEVVIQLEKNDINEELTRLGEHIKTYHRLLQSGSPEGKKMDFYTQELLREVNTIGSKSQLAKITQIVVEAKTIIERLREQVQNIE